MASSLGRFAAAWLQDLPPRGVSKETSLGLALAGQEPRPRSIGQGKAGAAPAALSSCNARPREKRSQRGRARANVAAAGPTAETQRDAAAYERLQQWVLERGGLRKDAAKWAAAPGPAGSGGAGWGLVAARDVSAGEEVVSVPESACLGMDVVRAAPEMAPFRDVLSPWASLALLLLLEKGKGSESAWGPYLRTLPSAEELNSPIFWSDAELEELQGTQVVGAVVQYREFVAAEWEKVQRQAAAGGQGAWAQGIDLAAFTWAFAVLRSRCFPPCVKASIALVPLLDLVNHGVSPTEAAWGRSTLPGPSASGGGGMGGLLGSLASAKGQPGLALVAGRAFKAGEEIVLDYGVGKSNGDLLLDYGFVEQEPALADIRARAASAPGALQGFLQGAQSVSDMMGAGLIGGAAKGAPESVASLSAAEAAVAKAAAAAESRAVYSLTLEVPEGDRFQDDKLDVLDLAGVSSPVTFDLRMAQPTPDTLLAFLRLVALSGPDAFLLEALFRNAVWDHLQFPVSRDNEEAVCRAMIDGCQDALSAYPTSVQEDARLLQRIRSGEEAVSPARATAVVVRLGEKRVLDSILTAFQQRLTSLDSLEYYAERRLRDMGLMDEKGNMTPWVPPGGHEIKQIKTVMRPYVKKEWGS